MKTILVLLSLVTLSLPTIDIIAQCDSNGQVLSATDTFYAVKDDFTLDSSIFIPPNELAAYFAFDYQQDSSRFQYRVGEFTKNSQWVYLNNWCLDKVYNFDEKGDSAVWDYSNAALSAISQTRTISVIASDTLSFFREFYWLDNTNGGIINASKLVSDDEISMSVDLVRESDGTRILLIDTIHVSSTTTSKKPCITAWKPVMARIGFLVPSSVSEATNVFVRANVYSSGPSGSSFMRSDMLQYRMSKQSLESSGWQNFSTSVVSENECSTTCYFSLTPLSGPRRISIDVDNGQSSLNKIITYDLYGDLINMTTLPSSDPFILYLSTGGLYISVGMYNESTVCSRVTFIP
ncbi:MAG: hypothetical protein HYX66_06040 [Ignavibacteria bacterium]|nr:hypothetical protein [Ignavibacteria bacterium]